MVKNFKQIVKGAFHKVGLDIRKLPTAPEPIAATQLPPAPRPWNYPEPPLWMHTSAIPTDAELEAGEFPLTMYGNRVFRSSEITLRRTRWGEDYRLKYLLMALDVRDLRVLELGPYFGHHTFMLDKLGAKYVVAVEGREQNLRVCEKMKQRFGLDRATFVLQDIEALAKGEKPKFAGPFDLVFCLGLLYHMPDPLSVLTWCRRQSPSLFMGTHYYEPAERVRYAPPAFTQAAFERDGRHYEGMWFTEGGPADGPSGLSPRSFWAKEADLIAMVRSAGYPHVNVLGRDLQNNLPHVTLIAEA